MKKRETQRQRRQRETVERAAAGRSPALWVELSGREVLAASRWRSEMTQEFTDEDGVTHRRRSRLVLYVPVAVVR